MIRRGTKGRTWTLTTVADAYLGDLAMRAKPATLKVARTAIRNAQKALGDDLGAIDLEALEAWRRARKASGAANRTINRDMGTVSALFEFARRRGMVKANPTADIRALPTKGIHRRKVARALPDGDVARLLAAARAIDARKPKRFPREPMLRTLFETGCRWYELASLLWADLDTDRATIRLRAQVTKTSVERTFPISPDLLAHILGLRDAHVRVTGDIPRLDSRVFLSPTGKPFGRWTGDFLAYLHDCLRLAGIPKADAAGRLVPSARSAAQLSFAVPARQSSRATRGKARGNREAANRRRPLRASAARGPSRVARDAFKNHPLTDAP